jgi:hypothetical protein
MPSSSSGRPFGRLPHLHLCRTHLLRGNAGHRRRRLGANAPVASQSELCKHGPDDRPQPRLLSELHRLSRVQLGRVWVRILHCGFVWATEGRAVPEADSRNLSPHSQSAATSTSALSRSTRRSSRSAATSAAGPSSTSSSLSGCSSGRRRCVTFLPSTDASSRLTFSPSRPGLSPQDPVAEDEPSMDVKKVYKVMWSIIKLKRTSFLPLGSVRHR